jgi:hypothetical protein
LLTTSIDEGAADVAFAGPVGGHAALGKDNRSAAETDEVKAGYALWGGVVDEVLNPGEVGVVLGQVADPINASTFNLKPALDTLPPTFPMGHSPVSNPFNTSPSHIPPP